MPDILIQVTIAAAPEKVYEAITQHLNDWWDPDAISGAKVGSIVQPHSDNAAVRGGGFATKLEVVTLEPARKIEWLTRQGVPDWSGTRVTWDVSPVENIDPKGTQLLFGHRGFASAEGGYPRYTYSWAYYLVSLKAYLETGKGQPGGLGPYFRWQVATVA